jgi:hypothetical protein
LQRRASIGEAANSAAGGSITDTLCAMKWVRLIAGVIVGLLGLVWLGQGLNFIPGSFMTGQMQWAVAGAVLLVLAAWLIWGTLRRFST